MHPAMNCDIVVLAFPSSLILIAPFAAHRHEWRQGKNAEKEIQCIDVCVVIVVG
jgi:hypothetical protein